MTSETISRPLRFLNRIRIFFVPDANESNLANRNFSIGTK